MLSWLQGNAKVTPPLMPPAPADKQHACCHMVVLTDRVFPAGNYKSKPVLTTQAPHEVHQYAAWGEHHEEHQQLLRRHVDRKQP